MLTLDIILCAIQETHKEATCGVLNPWRQLSSQAEAWHQSQDRWVSRYSLGSPPYPSSLIFPVEASDHHGTNMTCPHHTVSIPNVQNPWGQQQETLWHWAWSSLLHGPSNWSHTKANEHKFRLVPVTDTIILITDSRVNMLGQIVRI